MDAPQPKCPNCLYPIVVGIAGATRSGKSTLAKFLRDQFGCTCAVVQLDSYFLPTSKMPKEEVCPQYPNWESPLSLRWNELRDQLARSIFESTIYCVDCVSKAKQKSKELKGARVLEKDRYKGTRLYLFVEGFLLFQPDMLHYFDKKIFLISNKKMCKIRRMNTTYVPDDYFELLIWPEYLKHNAHIATIERICFLDASQDRATVFQKAKSYLLGQGDDGEYVEKMKELLKATMSSVLTCT